MKRIAILGSTGSIGKSTLEVVSRFPSDFKVAGLTTNSRIDILYRQIKKFKPFFVCVKEHAQARRLASKIGSGVKVFSGQEGLLQLLEDARIDQVVMAISGSAALGPLLKAIENGKDVALANKEALVMAGPIIMNKARKRKVEIIPIDSEQSAIWQCLVGQDIARLKNIYLTASGGPFRKLSKKRFKEISVKEALRHPRWKMGEKITVDSASLMNKGLEVLEAVYLFNVAPEKIKIVIHPESIIHSMVEYIDGVVLAQLSVTDMCIPIQYALTYPQRYSGGKAALDFYNLKRLNFEKPDFHKFPCLELAYRAAIVGGTMPCVLNAANEVSVSEFLKEKLDFVAIPKVIDKVLERHTNITCPDMTDVLESDMWARNEAYRAIERMRDYL
jgi:1-deoxy-D-xylulose-5-phosphate reductoisomerase